MKTEVTVRNCPVKIKFECPKKWDLLEKTGFDNVKYCSSCKSNVYFCRTDEETIRRAISGDCIAREIPLRSELPILFVGQVEVAPKETEEQKRALSWTKRENGIDSVITLIEPTKYCYSCGYPTSEWRKTCKVCGAGLNDAKRN